MTTNANPAANFADQSLGQLIVDAGADSDITTYWTDPSAALWAKACVAAGKSVGVAGCPSREVADFMFAVLGA